MTRWDEINMTPDEQEALSRRYSDDIIMLLPLRSGKIAVFNCESRTLCGVVDDIDISRTTWQNILDTWRRPSPPPQLTSKDVDLKELGLL